MFVFIYMSFSFFNKAIYHKAATVASWAVPAEAGWLATYPLLHQYQ